MSITKNKVISEMLTHDKAAEFANMTPAPGERDAKPQRIAHLEVLVNQGLFHGVDWHYVVDLKTGTRYRLDGQHSSKMLAALPPEKVPQVLATITEWTTTDIGADAFYLFEKFNQPWSTRSTADVMGVGVAPYPDLSKQVPKPFLVQIANGITTWIKDRNEQLKSEYERAKKKDPTVPAPLYEKVPNSRLLSMYFRKEERRRFAVWAHEMSKTPKGQPVKFVYLFGQSGVVAEMFEAWKRNAELASEFWGFVLNNNHEDVDHATRILGEQLYELKLSSKKVTQAKYRELTKKYFRRFIATHSTPAAAAAPPLNTAAEPLPASM